MAAKERVAKARVLMELGNQSQRSFLDRRATEWKVNFGVWTLLALSCWLIGTGDIKLPALLALLPFGLVAIHWYWLHQMHKRNRINKTNQHFYRDEINDLMRVKAEFESSAPNSPRSVINQATNEWWSLIPTILVSGLLALTASAFAIRASVTGQNTSVRLTVQSEVWGVVGALAGVVLGYLLTTLHAKRATISPKTGIFTNRHVRTSERRRPLTSGFR